MSTPISATPRSRRQEPQTEEDLQTQMQRMIDLQYQQQKHYRAQPDQTPKLSQKSFTEQPPPQHHNNTVVNEAEFHNSVLDEPVGQGTVIWNVNNKLADLHDSNSTMNEDDHDDALVPDQPHNNTMRLSKSAAQHNMYGTMQDHLVVPPPPPPPPNPHHLHELTPDMELPLPQQTRCPSLLSESLQRSFCYGAIDGMLTGSGILFTFLGLHLIEYRALIIVVCAAACGADSVGMGFGHVWTTYVLSYAQANERKSARTTFQNNKSHAKGLLVDMMLQKGMLKIDAMSLADTLEGYPDLFVNVLVGEPFANQVVEAPSRNGSFWKTFLSYGKLSDLDMDPDLYNIQGTLSESRKESVCMMLGFALFAIVPSLLFRYLDVKNHDIHPTTLLVFCMTIIMWFLGCWKSKFVDSNWLLFGVETSLVLLVCIFCAYGLGRVLGELFLPPFVLKEK